MQRRKSIWEDMVVAQEAVEVEVVEVEAVEVLEEEALV